MDGIIVINKPKGCTSHDIVYKIKKMFGVKVGHTGTLDPNATGVLPILIGKGTELSQFLINHDKKYVATIKLGVRTDTADSEGNIVEEKFVDESNLTEENVVNILKSMIGKQKQTPPIYSAIKVKGKKLYEYARSGKRVDIPEREIEIYDLKLVNIDAKEHVIKFEIFCSKGTYVRTVCEAIAEKLGTVGMMQDLERTKVGAFSINDSITIEELQENINNSNYLGSKIITIENFFENEQSISLETKKLKVLLNGVLVSNRLKDGIVRIYNEENQFIGIGINENGMLKRKIIINESTC